MKILIISDTHGAHRNFDRVIEKEQPLDMLIHLGDVEGDEDYIPAVADCPVHMVRGNNDFFSDLPGEEEFMIGGLSYIYYTRTWILCIYGRRTTETGGKRAWCRHCNVWAYTPAVL